MIIITCVYAPSVHGLSECLIELVAMEILATLDELGCKFDIAVFSSSSIYTYIDLYISLPHYFKSCYPIATYRIAFKLISVRSSMFVVVTISDLTQPGKFGWDTIACYKTKRKEIYIWITNLTYISTMAPALTIFFHTGTLQISKRPLTFWLIGDVIG